jgi:AhpD family alkylhydroperoxidase
MSIRISSAQSFAATRARLQAQLEAHASTGVKRFLALDHQAYLDGALSAKTKELLGLTASTVLRCDDCITFHLHGCRAQGVTDAELMEAFNVALVVGGSITLPHLRRALDAWLSLPAEPPAPGAQ